MLFLCLLAVLQSLIALVACSPVNLNAAQREALPRVFLSYAERDESIAVHATLPHVLELDAHIHNETLKTSVKALRAAVSKGHLATLAVLIEGGVPVHADSDTALYTAIKYDKPQVVDFLIQEMHRLQGHNPAIHVNVLKKAVRLGSYQITASLLRNCSFVNTGRAQAVQEALYWLDTQKGNDHALRVLDVLLLLLSDAQTKQEWKAMGTDSMRKWLLRWEMTRNFGLASLPIDKIDKVSLLLSELRNEGIRRDHPVGSL